MKNRLFVDNLTTLDFSYLHPARGIVGETWIMDVELYGELDEQGMLFDFGDVKKSMKRAAEALIDHKLVLPAALPGLALQDAELAGQAVRQLDYALTDKRHIRMQAPAEAYAELDIEEITAETVQPLMAGHLESVLPENVDGVEISLRTESIQGAYYHYSHGLKKHAGDCQRIAHGHRSRLQIHTDGQRNQLAEYQWAKRWKDIYIGTRADIARQFEIDGEAHYEFAYTAAQGPFSLSLPASSVYLMDVDSTVECIAEHIARVLKAQRPQSRCRVRAYEGLNKGALAEL